jgi:hypothetical protein
VGGVKKVAQGIDAQHRPKEGPQFPQKLHLQVGMPGKKPLEQTFFTTKYHDIHKPNALANGPGKRIQYIYSRDDPFCESIVSILGLIESRDLVSQDGEDSLGGIARLKAGKERVLG